MAKIVVLVLSFIMLPAKSFSADIITLRPTMICLGDDVCVAQGVTHSELGRRFKLPSKRRLKLDDAYSMDCFKLGERFVLVTYSSQGRVSAQPEQIDISTTRQTQCDAPSAAMRHVDVPLLPVALGTSEEVVIERFGKPSRVWTPLNSAHGLHINERGLVYGVPEENEFVMVVVSNSLVTRVIGSIVP